MKATLRDEVQVQPIAVFAEVGMLERRPEIQRLCQRAAAQPDQRLTPAVCQQALPGLSATGAANLVRGCAAFDLCDLEGHLTQDGHEAAQSGLLSVPEQGIYRLWLAQHPLLGRRAIHIERLAVDGRDQDYALKDPPMRLSVRSVFTSVINGTRFRLLREPIACRIEPALRGRCTLRWEIDFAAQRSRFTLTGQLDEGIMITEQYEDAPVDHAALLQRWTHGDWDEGAGLLRVPIAGLPEAAQESFRMDRALGDVEVPNKGRYRGVTLRAAPLGPADDDAAQRWAMLRFDRRCAARRGYLSKAERESLFAAAVADTPLTAFTPTLPSLDSLLAERERAGDRWGYFQLAASEDLCL